MRCLAFDVRPHKFGYVVIEVPTRLVDWGVREFESVDALGNQIADLLQLYRPSVLIVRKFQRDTRRDRATTRLAIGRVQGEATRMSIPIAFVAEKELKAVFLRYGKETKHDVASFLAECFPELAWKLPPKRKPWETEHWRTPIFDAAALALSYLISKVDAEIGMKAART